MTSSGTPPLTRVRRGNWQTLATATGCAFLLAAVVLLDLAGFWFVYQGAVCLNPCSPYVGPVDRPWFTLWTAGGLAAGAVLPLSSLVLNRWPVRFIGRASSLSIGAFPFAWYMGPQPNGPGWPGWPVVYVWGGPFGGFAWLVLIAVGALGTCLVWYGVPAAAPTPPESLSARVDRTSPIWASVVAWSFAGAMILPTNLPVLIVAGVLAGTILTGVVLSHEKARLRRRRSSPGSDTRRFAGCP